VFRAKQRGAEHFGNDTSPESLTQAVARRGYKRQRH
jgi:hypothetical protein